MLISTKGIVFRSVKYSETSFISDIYTAEKGLQSFIISGVRKAKSKTGAGLFQPGSLLEVEAYFRAEKKVHRIKEVRLSYPYKEIPFSIQKTAVGIFMAELCSKTIKESEPNPNLFDFIWTSFIYLDTTAEAISNLPISFMCNLAKGLGINPQLSLEKVRFFDMKEGVFCNNPEELSFVVEGDTIPTLMAFFSSIFAQAHTVQSTRIERKEILATLTQYFSLHLNGFEKLNSPAVYGAIF